MSNELKIQFTPGVTLYAMIENAAGQLWNTSGTPAFENQNASHIGNYAITITEGAVTGLFIGSMVAAAAGVYGVLFRQQAGGSPAISDPPAGSGVIYWTGSAEAFPSSTTDTPGTGGGSSVNYEEFGPITSSLNADGTLQTFADITITTAVSRGTITIANPSTGPMRLHALGRVAPGSNTFTVADDNTFSSHVGPMQGGVYPIPAAGTTSFNMALPPLGSLIFQGASGASGNTSTFGPVISGVLE